MKAMIALLLAGGLCGCAYPVTTVDQGSAPTVLFVPYAPADAILVVDGVSYGPASAFNGKKTAVLAVAPGKHRVVVSSGPGNLYDKNIYVGAGSKVAVELNQ